MVVKEVAGKWHTVSKNGKVGKRGYTSEANAQAAQDRGRALLASSGGAKTSLPSSVSEPSPALSDSEMDTTEERKALGIPAKPAAKSDPEAF